MKSNIMGTCLDKQLNPMEIMFTFKMDPLAKTKTSRNLQQHESLDSQA